MPLAASLPVIAALARSGAVRRAWELFEAGGWAARTDDPAALSLMGRLLKDRARVAAGAGERVALFGAAASAYAAAHALAPAPYRAINAATARLLAGDPAGAAQGAQAVLDLLDAPTPPADTPYFLAATRAEALLLLGRADAAAAAMGLAVAADPDGWDDRAVTLAQLREICAALGQGSTWLDPFAPPASLHFAGHMGLASGGASEAALVAAIDGLLARTGVGFAWGALAAGADIVIAERLLAAEVELHAVLPCPPEAFAAQSVSPAGADWLARYHAVLDRAASLRVAGSSPAGVHDPLATAHAGLLAIGAARLNARQLGSRALQLLVEDEAGGGPNTARQAALWSAGAGPQERVRITRDAAVEQLFPPEAPDPARRLVTHLAVLLDLPREFAASTDLAPLLDPVAQAIVAAGVQPTAVRAGAGRWDITLEDQDLALALVRRLAGLAAPRPAIGLHLAIGPVLPDPASGALVGYGAEAGLAGTLAAMAPAGTALASDALAVALAAGGAASVRTECYHPGEAETGGAVHLLLFDQ